MNRIIKEDLQNIYDCSVEMWDKLRGRTVLITGGTGMIGAYMVWMLVYLNELNPSYNIKFILVARNVDKVKRIFGKYTEKSYFFVLKKHALEEIAYDSSIDYIIHAAALASPQFHNSNPVGVMSTNILGTYYTLELAKKKKVKGYLFFSANVFGKLEKDMICEEDCGLLEPVSYKNCYTESKRAGETMCKCYTHQYHLPTRIVRPCHTYGPTMDVDNDQRVFSSFAGNIVRNQDIEIKSDGLAVRNFCYIADAVLGYFLVLLKGRDGEIYNVSNEEARCSMRDLAQFLCDLYPEKKLKVIYGKPAPSYSENVHKVMPNYSTDKLKELGWVPRYGVRDGFKRTLDAMV